MKTWVHFFSQLRRNERDFVLHSHMHGYVGMELTPILFLLIGLLYLLNPYDLLPEILLGPFGYIEDILILILICIYNNPIEVVTKLLYGRRPGGFRMVSKEIYNENPVSQIIDKIEEVPTAQSSSAESSSSQSTYVDPSIPQSSSVESAVPQSAYVESAIPSNDDFLGAEDEEEAHVQSLEQVVQAQEAIDQAFSRGGD